MEILLILGAIGIVWWISKAYNKSSVPTSSSEPTIASQHQLLTLNSCKPILADQKNPTQSAAPTIELNEEFQRALTHIEQKDLSLFITGKAGTGKSTLIKHFKNSTRKNAVLLAPTGLAAVNIRGQTIHSFFKFPPRLIERKTIRRSRNAALYHAIDTIIIDEISMVRTDLMEGIDYSLRINRENDEPFGGVQLVLSGDLHQLPPVVRGRTLIDYFERRYGGPYFFNAKAFKNHTIHSLQLQKIYRQHEKDFIEILNSVREDKVDDQTLDLINRKVAPEAEDDEDYVVLTSTNETASRINQSRLARIPHPPYTFHAIISGAFKDDKDESSSYPTDATLTLKTGAKIMMVKNDSERRWVNGTIGHIYELRDNKIFVEIAGSRHEVRREIWEKIQYEYDEVEKRITEKIIGTFEQFPLRLAWAITIHKSMGQTFDRIFIDFEGGAFAHGQAYVALSRCTSLDGIALRRSILYSDIILDERINKVFQVFPPLP